MEIITPAEVTKQLEMKTRGEFADVIRDLPEGGALKINPVTWPRRENIYHFFLTRFKKQVSVRRMDNCYFIIKLPVVS